AAARVTCLQPVALVGLVAAAIPALLHLLGRRVPPEAEFPPLRYLSEAERQSARRLKLRHLLLLLLRTALIALVVLAAARPLFPTQASGGSLHEPTALVVILDNSASSGLVVDGHPVLGLLQGMARGSLAGVPRGVRGLALAPPSQAFANRGVGAARVTDGAAAIGIVGTPGAAAEKGAASVTLRIHGREVGRALAVPGSTVTIMLPSLGPGWWVGEVVLDADELRADDRRWIVWRVAPPARV